MMRFNRIRAGFGIVFVVVFLVSNVRADKGAGQESWAMKRHKKIAKGVPIPKTLPKIWADITVMRAKLNETIGDNKHEETHNLVYAISDHVRAMPKKSSSFLSEFKLDDLKERSKIIAGIAEDIDEAVETGNIKKAYSLLGFLDREIRAVREIYPNGVLAAEGTYACPIEPGIVSAEFGKCPRCGMDFVVKNN